MGGFDNQLDSTCDLSPSLWFELHQANIPYGLSLKWAVWITPTGFALCLSPSLWFELH